MGEERLVLLKSIQMNYHNDYPVLITLYPLKGTDFWKYYINTDISASKWSLAAGQSHELAVNLRSGGQELTFEPKGIAPFEALSAVYPVKLEVFRHPQYDMPIHAMARENFFIGWFNDQADTKENSTIMFGIIRLDFGFIEGYWSKNVSKDNGVFIIRAPKDLQQSTLVFYLLPNTGGEIIQAFTMDPNNFLGIQGNFLPG
jgi:hypothetical protein